MKGSCFDPDPKIVLRTYRIGEFLAKFRLCKQHSKDHDFDDFISETPINQENSEVIQN